MKENIRQIVHPFSPVFDQNSKILILGTFPSPKSVENRFYYGHPQNRFWRVLSYLLGKPVPESPEGKTAFLLASGIALWDVLYSCTIEGAADSSICDPVPNDISSLLQKSGIARAFCNGRASHSLYAKHVYPKTGIEAVYLPSTSPANAAASFERLTEQWKVILPYLNE